MKLHANVKYLFPESFELTFFVHASTFLSDVRCEGNLSKAFKLNYSKQMFVCGFFKYWELYQYAFLQILLLFFHELIKQHFENCVIVY